MSDVRRRLPFALPALAAVVLLAGCGGGSGANSTSSNTPSPAPPATSFATETPPPDLPELSSISLQPGEQGQYQSGMYLVDAATGQPYQIVTAPGPILDPWEWISPTQLVLCGWVPQDRNCYLLDIDAKTLRRLPRSDQQDVTVSHSGDLMTSLDLFDLVISRIADDQEIGRIVNGPNPIDNWNPYVRWSPDDTRLFLRAAGGATGYIASVEATPQLLPAGTVPSGAIVDWTPDSRSVVFADQSGVSSIDAATGQTTRLFAWPAGSSITPDEVRVSPDGRFALVLAFAARDAYVVPLGGSATGIHISNVESMDIAWSPKGDVLALIADRCTADSRLLLVNADGSVRTTINGANFIARFSADGSMVAYEGLDPAASGPDAAQGIVVRNAGDYSVASFVPGLFDDTSWSPDGRWFSVETALMPPPYANSCVETASKTEIRPFP